MLSQQLREQTKSNHQNLEKILIPQIKSIRTREDYGKVIQVFYQYFGALEHSIDQFIDAEILPDYLQRRKTASLKNDLVLLGCTDYTLTSNGPEIKNYLQALGALYVVEGSTLGGEIISKMIIGKLGDEIEPALSFFKGYGDDSKHMWEVFQKRIDEMNLSNEQIQKVIESANSTFMKFSELALIPVS